MKTKIKKAIALTSILGILLSNSVNVFAEKIGEINAAYNAGSLTVPVDVNKDGNTASGSLGGIIVTANVSPILNLILSNTTINLGNIVSERTGSIKLEAGTNSPNGLTITAISENGGLAYGSGATADELINSANGGTYKFSSRTGEGSTDGSGTPTFLGGEDITAASYDTKSAVIYTSGGKPEKSSGVDDVEFVITAKAQESAKPGDYVDYITFNITATF